MLNKPSLFINKDTVENLRLKATYGLKMILNQST